MPAALIGTAQFAISLSTNCARYSGDRRSGVTTVAPMLLSCSWTAAVDRGFCGVVELSHDGTRCCLWQEGRVLDIIIQLGL